MKRLTIRIDDNIYEDLFILSKKNKTSVNKLIATLLSEYFNNSSYINYLKEIIDKLNELNRLEEKISKRQYKHFKLSQQHFANFGYLSNADISEDKCLNDLLNQSDNFNE